LAKFGWYGFGVTDDCDCPLYLTLDLDTGSVEVVDANNPSKFSE
jgi:hypothetical protein